MKRRIAGRKRPAKCQRRARVPSDAPKKLGRAAEDGGSGVAGAGADADVEAKFHDVRKAGAAGRRCASMREQDSGTR